MKNINKLVSLSLGVLMTTSILTGCSTNGLAVYNAFSKSQKIKSCQTQFDLNLNISAANMSPAEQQNMQKVLPLINNSKISILTTTNANEEKTLNQMQSSINAQFGLVPINAEMWVNTDNTKDKPVIKEIFKMPAILTSYMPQEYSGKQYMIFNYDDVSNVPNAPKIDYKKIIDSSKDFQAKFDDFIASYVKQFNPSLNAITKLGNECIYQPNVVQTADTYQLKLDDKSFKGLLRYSLNNFSNNKDAINFIKYYVSFINSSIESPQGQASISENELNSSLAALPETVKELNKNLDALDKVKIIGDKGITIKYAINRDGYIINEKGNAEFVIDSASLSNLEKDVTLTDNSSPNTGVYTVNLTFNNDIRNINGYNPVTFPEVTKSNSFNYSDLLKSTLDEQKSIK